MTTRTITTTALAAAAGGIGWALAKLLAVPDHETDHDSLFEQVPDDELAARRTQRARVTHPSVVVIDLPPYTHAALSRPLAPLGVVVPFRTPDQAS